VKRERSIHFRLTAWYAVVLAAALGLFGGLIWLSLRARLLSEVDEDLASQARSFQAFVQTEALEVSGDQLKEEIGEFSQALPPSGFLEVRDAEGRALFRYPIRLRGSMPEYRTVSRDITAAGRPLHFEIGTSLRSIRHTLDLLSILLLALSPVVIAIACLGGAWLSRRAMEPVDRITTAARTIGIDNLSQRLHTPQTGDELQRLTEVWNTMLERLESAVKTLSQFAADASHELRTPLAVIRTSAELALRRARSPESYRDSLHDIAEEAKRMTELVDDLLFLARHDAQAGEMPREPLDLPSLVNEATAELRDLAELRQIRVRSSCDGPALVSGNRPALRRLFLVLLDNAMKYSRPGSEVVVTIAHEDRGPSVTIEDFGVGIAEADQPHIFKRFYQADKARADGGFGLGLSLAESIARAHGATIGVSSTEGAGSTFRVVFSAESSEAAAAEQGLRDVRLSGAPHLARAHSPERRMTRP
jgi:signal transduction histidine kinase